ncbi:hypothetical protein [Zhihengliuella sp.]|uniref:hypothetical protein n=1 Tax=Zhihengliuella sp. TaxID=1954483 RepID=UPI00281258B1|nr:hypothetical protein [Zhihengliuella sp.]
MTSAAGRSAVALRVWARGDLALEATVALLLGGGGSLVEGPWVRPGSFGAFWFDADTASAECGHLSGGERRVLAIAASLASANHPVDLGDAVTGLDPAALRCVLDAMAHAGGLRDLRSATRDHHEPR